MAPGALESIVVAVGTTNIGVAIEDPALAELFAVSFTALATDSSPDQAVSIAVDGDRYSILVDAVPGYSGTDPANVLDHLVSWLNMQAVTSRSEFINLHAAGLVAPGATAATILPAPPGSGKTTLAAAAASHGWGYMSDEVVSLDGQGTVTGYAKPLTIKTGTVPLVDADYETRTLSAGQTRWYVPATELGASIVENATPGVLVFAQYEPDSLTEAVEMSICETILELAINCQDELEADGAALLQLGHLAARCHRFRLTQRNVDEAIATMTRFAALAPVATSEIQALPGARSTPTRGRRGPQADPEVIGVVAPDGVVVHHPGSRAVAALDPLAGAIWQLLDGTATEEELIDELATTFAHSRDVVAADVSRLLTTLREQGLVAN